MSNKTLMGVALAATVAIAFAPVASFAKKVECYGAKNAKDNAPMMMKSAKACKKAGGTTKKLAGAEAKPATTETPAS